MKCRYKGNKIIIPAMERMHVQYFVIMIDPNTCNGKGKCNEISGLCDCNNSFYW